MFSISKRAYPRKDSRALQRRFKLFCNASYVSFSKGEIMRAQSNQSKSRKVDRSRRRCLKRIAYSLGAAFVAATLLGVSGCKSTNSKEKGYDTIDDFLKADKPGW